MDTGKYILDGKTPQHCTDLFKWGEWYETADRSVKITQIDDALISTVFLGLDRNLDGATPLLFETTVFGGEHDEEMCRYSTWDEAEAGHEKMVKFIEEN